MEALMLALEVALREDPVYYSTGELRTALRLIEQLRGGFREVLRQRGADGQ